MPNGLKLSILADTKDAVRGARDVSDELDKVADSLDDLARDSKKSGDKLGEGLEDGAKDGAKAVDKLERSFKDMADSAKKEGKKAGDDIGDGFKRGTKDAGDGLRDLKDETNSSFREAAASATGSIEDIGDTAQEVLANAFAGFGPIGAAAGIAAAVGLGAITTAINEEAEASEERIAGMYDSFLESQNDFLSQSYIQERIAEIAGSTDEYARAVSDAESLGLDLSVVLRAQAGDSEALAAVQGTLKTKLDEATVAAQSSTGAYDAQSQSAGAQFNTLGELQGRYTGVNSEMQTAASRANAAKAAMDQSTQSYIDAGKSVSDLNGELRTLPNGKTIFISADSSAFERKVQEITATRTMTISLRALERLGGTTG